MKILIITENIGKTSPGIVFERLVYALSLKHDIDLLVADYNPSINLSKLSNVRSFKKKNIHPRIDRFFLTYFGFNPFDSFWAWKITKAINETEIVKYDVILSFLSFNHYIPLIAGSYLSRKYNKKFAVHAVDAVPAPLGWLNDNKYYAGLWKMVGNYLSYADGFFSANLKMLEYQLNGFLSKEELLSDVIYNPTFGTFHYLPLNNEIGNQFIFTGGIYSVRKADFVIQGFEKLLDIYPNSKLLFIGTREESLSFQKVKRETVNKIEVIPYTDNLKPYYMNATALIDIDAAIDNDVFLSGKITDYLMVNRVIISQTGVNSPSRHLFKDIDSIIQCDHDSDQIFEAMKKSIAVKELVDFNDRNKVIELFKLENVVEKLNKALEKLVS